MQDLIPAETTEKLNQENQVQQSFGKIQLIPSLQRTKCRQGEEFWSDYLDCFEVFKVVLVITAK